MTLETLPLNDPRRAGYVLDHLSRNTCPECGGQLQTTGTSVTKQRKAALVSPNKDNLNLGYCHVFEKKNNRKTEGSSDLSHLEGKGKASSAGRSPARPFVP